jgi:hypothetical protein
MSFQPNKGGIEINTEETHTPAIIIPIRFGVRFIAYWNGLVITKYRSTLIMHKFKMLAVYYRIWRVSSLLAKKESINQLGSIDKGQHNVYYPNNAKHSTGAIIIPIRFGVRFIAYWNGLVITKYRSTLIMHKFNMEAVHRITSKEVNKLHTTSPSAQYPITSYVVTNGIELPLPIYLQLQRWVR